MVRVTAAGVSIVHRLVVGQFGGWYEQSRDGSDNTDTGVCPQLSQSSDIVAGPMGVISAHKAAGAGMA